MRLRLPAVRSWSATAAVALAVLGFWAAGSNAPSDARAGQGPPGAAPSEAPTKPASPPEAAKKRPAEEEAALVKLSPDYDVWLDKANRRLVLKGEVCQQQGPLEMLVTIDGTLKTHESVVACKVEAFIVHAGLLALGAKPGGTVRFSPEFRPPAGTEIEVRFRWTDAAGKVHEHAGQEWVRSPRTKRAMTSPFVFAGSGFLVNQATGERAYQAEGGDFICVSNFPTAMLDVPFQSTQSDSSLEFEAFYERIPPKRTPVTVLLTPKFPAAAPQR